MYAVSNETMRASDRATIASGVEGKELMLRAAKALLEILLLEPDCKINIFCGSGNNGGDGYALATLLYEKNIDFTIYGLNAKTQEAGYYFDICKKLFPKKVLGLYEIVKIINTTDTVNAIAIDCVYGSGYYGELSEDIQQVTSIINKHKTIISCDIPSGVNGDNGIACKNAVKANKTLAIGSLKTGHLLNDAKDYVGVVSIADIGIEIVGEKYTAITEEDCLKCFPKRLNNTHKGSYGKVKIIACSESYVGAGIISATSCVNAMGETALNVGAGLCVLCVPDEMLSSFWGRVLHCTLEKRSEMTLGDCVIAYGMGIGSDNGLLPKILNQNMPVLIDADGIIELAENLDILASKKCEVVLTPHPREMSRLTGKSVNEILENPIITAKSFAKEHGVVVLLKGCSTVVTDGDRVAIVTDGTPAMAKGGSGDALSGVIVGLIAKGNSTYDSACVGASIAGKAALLAESVYTQDTVSAIDTAQFVKDVIKQMS